MMSGAVLVILMCMLQKIGATNNCLVNPLDTNCTQSGGICQLLNNACSGTYKQGLCDGPFTRQCCVSPYGIKDAQCTGLGGLCIDWEDYDCMAGFLLGKCGCSSERRCCRPCDCECLSREEIFRRSPCDVPCGNASGKCKETSNHCQGNYTSNKCCGPNSRQCCLPPQNIVKPAKHLYGDIGKLTPTGASLKTAKASKLTYAGVRASREIASIDLLRMKKYKDMILRESRAANVDPAVVAAIISRESNVGTTLKNGFGDGGNGFGLMQVDKRYHRPLKGTWDSAEHIRQGIRILVEAIKSVQKKNKDNCWKWSKAQQLQGGIAAYNFGVKNVQTWKNLDHTKKPGPRDYSNDVVARAQYFRENCYK